MTRLLIAGVEVVLPQNFSCTVKRENSFFTKSGEYTYDVTLRLDNPVNLTLYGFLNRTNKSGQLETDRTAVLIADGHVYCRGREVVTRWTDQTVTIQIVSGESELNYFVGQDRKIEDLDLGRADVHDGFWADGATPIYYTDDFCLPPVRTPNGRRLNLWYAGTESEGSSGNYHTYIRCENPTPQPYLCALLEKIIEELGYNVDNHYEMVNKLRDTPFRNLFLVNTIQTMEYAKMLPGWTVKDFLTEVERLTGIVFVTDNVNKRCDILLKTSYYLEARQIPLSDVVDAYETEIEDDDSREAEFTSSDVSYELPDHRWASLMKLPEGVLASATKVNFSNFDDLKAAASTHNYSEKTLLCDTSTGRYYIMATRVSPYTGTDRKTFLIEVNAFADLNREDNDSTLELKITPAPMVKLIANHYEQIDLGDSDGYLNVVEEEEGEEEESEDTFEDVIRNYSDEKTADADLYCAFCHSTATRDNVSYPLAFTDAYHAMIQHKQWISPATQPAALTGLVGSLRLKDLEDTYYQGGYEIDTRHAMTFETFDPNVIDPRQVYVIRNRRYVVRDVEEVITAEGRQKKWKLTAYPITVSDEAIEKRWVLTKGVWDDGAAWLDDGRWNDSNPE